MSRSIKIGYVVWFLIVVIGCSFCAWLVMNKANERLNDTHDIIISHHRKSVQATDSLLNLYNRLVSDSLKNIKNVELRELCDNLSKITEKAAFARNDERIGNLLDTELSKIQSEYETLNLWCALITVVFLIFSFYSIFKASEMATEGERILDEVKRIKKDVHQKADTIDDEVGKVNDQIKEMKKSIEVVKTEKDNISQSLKHIQTEELEALELNIKKLKESELEYETKAKELKDELAMKAKELQNEIKKNLEGSITILKEERQTVTDNLKLIVEGEARTIFSTSNDKIQKELHNLKRLYEELKDKITGNNENIKYTPDIPDNVHDDQIEEEDIDGIDADEEDGDEADNKK